MNKSTIALIIATISGIFGTVYMFLAYFGAMNSLLKVLSDDYVYDEISERYRKYTNDGTKVTGFAINQTYKDINEI